MANGSGQQQQTSFEKPSFASKFLRIRIWLIALTFVPLLGATALVLDEVNQVRESRAESAAMTSAVDEIEQLGLLRASLLGERTWSAAQTSMAGDGDRLVRSEPSIDPAALEAEAAAQVDLLLQNVDLPQVEQELALLRGNASIAPAFRNTSYDDLGEAIDLRMSGLLEEMALSNGPGSSSSQDALVRIGLLVITSVAFAFGLASSIGRPLSSLAAGTRRLRDGSGWAPLKPSGPTEVREALLALNEAAAHLELAERQAKVLSEGRLDADVLNERAPGALGQSLQDAVQTLAESLNDREEFRRRLSHEATHDGLTQLANRKASLSQLQQSLARTARTGSILAVMFIDLDGFKEINDNFGHPVGDAVLWTLGKRMNRALRGGDHVGRLGGDEFLIIAEPVAGADEARMLANRVAQEVSEPMEIDGVRLQITVSIGVALADGANDLTASELLHDADLAVYRAKELGRSRIELCDEALHRELTRRSAIEDALRTAIANDELTMHFQPVLDANTAELSSLEALIRWNRPGVGLIPPDVFIPIAERTDLIREIDNWVVRHVVGQLNQWTHTPHLRHVPIAINVSGRHLATEGFVNDVLSPIFDAGVDPARLILEITESALLDDLDLAADKLRALRNHNIKIAIDDFGTGYTSLGHLRLLPIDILKIDRTFIKDESARSLVKLIIDTGHLIGASITSEGIETEQQAMDLSALGSDALQGYLFARPMPAAAVEEELQLTTAGFLPFHS